MVRTLCIIACILAIVGAGGIYALVVYQNEQEKNRQVALKMKALEEQTRRDQLDREAGDREQQRRVELETAKFKEEIAAAVRSHEAALAAERERAEVEKARLKAGVDAANAAARAQEANLETTRERNRAAEEQRQRETDRVATAEADRKRAQEDAARRAQQDLEAKNDAALYEILRQVDAAKARLTGLRVSVTEWEAEAETLESQVRALRTITAVCEKETKRLQANTQNLRTTRSSASELEGTTVIIDNRETLQAAQARQEAVAQELQRSRTSLRDRERDLNQLRGKIKSADADAAKVEAQLTNLYQRPEMQKAGATK